MKPRVLALLAAFSLTNCFHVKNQLYNPTDGKQPLSTRAVFSDHDRPDEPCDPGAGHACLAFLEFDEMGEMWDPAQLTKALDLIRRAKEKSTHPIVVTFTHGWKNNADDELWRNSGETNPPHHVNANVFGFEGVLDYLEHPTADPHRFADSPIIGIYIGWRGNLISEYWPVRQQFTYFNREGAAIRIPGASLTGALIQIMRVTHDGVKGPRVIMVGHSFGGLVMERALTQAMTDYILSADTPAVQAGWSYSADKDSRQGAWADLVVFVNSAAAASEGKQMLDLLKGLVRRKGLEYSLSADAMRTQALSNPGLSLTPQRPLFLSISSVGDIATRFGLFIGHGPSAINRQLTGSWRTYTHPDIPSLTSQQSYYLSTTAHMPALQSHLIVEDTPQSLKACGPLFSSAPIQVVIGQNTPGQKYVICEKPNRWNDTPYWAMEMPTTIVPDHSGIFNTNFVTLLERFLPTRQQMENPANMPELRVTK